jgi:hypothetical protein
LWLGVGLILLAIVLFICRIVSDGLLLVWHKTILEFFEPPRYKCRLVRANELQQHHAYWEKFFPGDVSSLAQNEAWYRKNNKLFWFLFEVASRKGKRHEPKLVGSFSMIPLTKRAAQQVSREQLAGSGFTAEHIAKASRPPVAIYIGGVIAEGFFAKGEVLARLSERIERLQEKEIPIFTRPVTDKGLSLVNKYDFEPTGEESGLKHIYRLGKPFEGALQA